MNRSVSLLLPGAVTAFFGALGWWGTALSRDLLDSPAVVLEVRRKDDSGTIWEYQFENLSSGTVFDPFIVRLELQLGNCRFVTVTPRPRPPTPPPEFEPQEEFQNYIRFTKAHFHPGATLHFEVSHNLGSADCPAGNPDLGQPFLFLESATAVRLVEPGVQTFVLRNRSWLLPALLLLWLVAILWMSRRAGPGRGKKPEPTFRWTVDQERGRLFVEIGVPPGEEAGGASEEVASGEERET